MARKESEKREDDIHHLSICQACRHFRAVICLDFMFGGHQQLCGECCRKLHPDIAKMAGLEVPEAQ